MLCMHVVHSMAYPQRRVLGRMGPLLQRGTNSRHDHFLITLNTRLVYQHLSMTCPTGLGSTEHGRLNQIGHAVKAHARVRKMPATRFRI